jgi:hypothetical protein
MTKGPTHIDTRATTKPELNKRRVILRTRAVECGEGKRIWKRRVDEFEFEGFTLFEIAGIHEEDLAKNFNESIQYPREELMVDAKTEDSPMGVAELQPRRRRVTPDSSHPSVANTFLAIAALAVTGIYWVSGNIAVSACVGAVLSVIVTGIVHHFYTRTSKKVAR